MKKGPPYKLRPFQREDVTAIKKAGLNALIASAMGSGKSAVSIRSLYEKHSITFPALIIAPASVTENWADEIQMWAPGVRIVMVDDMDSKIPRLRSPHVFYVMSWALLDTRLKELKRLKLKSVIADEIHYAKSKDTLRSQAFARLCGWVKYKLLLSGTPIVNTKTELEVVKGYLGRPNPLMIRRLLEDVAPDIPPKKRSYLNIRLRPKHQRKYDKANQDFADWLLKEKEKLMDGGLAEEEVQRALAAEALTKVGYLRRLVGKYKVPAALDWISRAVRVGEPVVVFIEHKDTFKLLKRGLKKLHLRHVAVHGGTGNRARKKAIDAFQKGKVPIFIGSKAAAVGITLTRARHLLFVERYYTSADEEQAEDRIRRIGQTRRTTMWYLHAVDTIDDRLAEIVETKRKIVRSAIGSSDVAETKEKNIQQLIMGWNKAVGRKGKVRDLGQGKPLQPLPKSKDVYAVTFYGQRWDEKRARVWCRMHGYKPRKTKHLKGRIKLEHLPIDLFQKGQFASFKVCKDIVIIKGRRLSTNRTRAARHRLSRK